MYFPVLILASVGFDASSGIAHECPIRIAPGMRSSLHKVCMRRGEIPQRSEVWATDRYFIISLLFELHTKIRLASYSGIYIILVKANKIKQTACLFFIRSIVFPLKPDYNNY